MTLDEREIAAARAVFGAEAEDAIAGLTQDLLALEQARAELDAAPLRERVRGALHTLKGSAGMVGLAEVSTLLHAVETALGGERPPGGERPEVVTAVLDALDAVRTWIERSRSGQGVATGELEAAARAVSAAAPRGPSAAAAPGAPEESARPAPTGTAGPDPGPEPPRAFVHAPTAMLDGLMGRAEDLVMGAAGLRARVASLAGAREQLEGLLRAARGAAARSGSGHQSQDALGRLHQALDGLARELAGDSERIDALTSAMLDGLRELRMEPFGELCAAFHRPVREMARELGKSVRLEVRAGDVRLDKQVLEGMKGPLVHLLRNAVAHGIEAPARRAAAEKAPTGTIGVRAERRGNRVVIAVSDDGAGLDVAAVRDEAIRRGLLDPAAPLGVEAAAELVFQPGFSTRRDASAAAGRGVGLSVVRESVERHGGEVRLSSRPGAGSEFTLTLPLSMAASRGLLVRVGGELFAIPVLSVERVARVAAGQVRILQGVATLDVDGEPVRLASLATLLGRPGARLDGTGGVPVVLVAGVRRRVALQVDAILGELAIVVKDLPPPLAAIEVLDGATVLDDGRVVPVLSVQGLSGASGEGAGVAAGPAAEPRRLLVVDDSATTRLLMARELEAAGYRVTTAADGAQALALLETEEVHAIVSDVNMPNVDGLELARTVRATPALANLPVLLVTSADTEADRVRGADAGADGYFVKKSFAREAVLAILEQAMRRRGVA